MAQALLGQVAIVTGSDSGIGQATAVEFAREGAAILITYLHPHVGRDGPSRSSISR
jgi:glucose 1-dehydrogenase